MVNPGRSGQTEDRVGRAVAPTVTRRVVRLECLENLKNLQERLHDYIRGYISFRELSEVCEETSGRLALGERESYRMGDPQYWRDVQRGLSDASVIWGSLPKLIREEFKVVVEEYDEKLEEARNAVASIIRSPQGDMMSVLKTAHLCVDTVQEKVRSITRQAKNEVDKVLPKIQEEIRVIFEYVEVGEAGISGVVSEHVDSYAKKLQEEAKAGRQPLQSGTRMGRPAGESRQGMPRKESDHNE